MSMNSMTVKSKLYISYGAMAGLALIMGVASIVILNSVATTSQKMGVTLASKLILSSDVRASTANMRSLGRVIALRTLNHEPAAAEKFVAEYVKSEAEARATVAKLREIGLTEEGTALVDKIISDLDKSDPAFQHVTDKMHSGSPADVLAVYQAELLPAIKVTEEAPIKLEQLQQEQMSKGNEENQGEVAHGRWIMTILLLVGGVIGAFLVFVIRGLDAQLRQSVVELSEGSDQVSSAATQVSSSSQSLAKDTSEQAAMIEETSASAEEINSMARRNAESARSATNLVTEAVSSTEQTNRAVADCVAAMDAIGESSSKIGKTLQVIDKIAFQTNILALNAAVEAARAGEAGAGFAVVAEEVRNLAQRCAAASEEISTLIEQSLGNSDSGRAKMATLVESGNKVNQVFASMKVLVEEISLSSEEQGRGIDQIGRAIQKMEQGTQKSAANAEESAAAAEQLNAQSEQLREVASALGAMVGAVNTTSSRRRSSY